MNFTEKLIDLDSGYESSYANAVIEKAPALRILFAKLEKSGFAVFSNNKSALEFAQSETKMNEILPAYNSNAFLAACNAPLFVELNADIQKSFNNYVEHYGCSPKVVFVQGLGFFALGKTIKNANIIKNNILNIILNISKAENLANIINNYVEKETYTSDANIQIVSQINSRMVGKIFVVTGAAQGFGEGIARYVAANGAYVVIADMNTAGAQALAKELCNEYGDGCAIGVNVNVADEESVKNMILQTVIYYGGLDVMVSCAGILIAGSLVDLTKIAFDKVTAVNYTGYFLCVKYSSVVLKTQNKYFPLYTSDIIEINSKSGLEGSKANFAYAGSKFGGLGLTQSFALELAEYGIKVNAICPGNLLDGPLWSDPEKGLFKQYLDAGKVSGAKTTQDVRRFYENKVPLGRGCTVEDVAKALMYIVEQQYETGQAVPVTGGQVMLN